MPLEIAYLRRHQIEALCWGRGFIVSFKFSFYFSSLNRAESEMGSKISENISLVHSIISEDSFTLNEDEGCHHPDHQEEVDGHDGIGNGSGVQLVDPCLWAIWIEPW